MCQCTTSISSTFTASAAASATVSASTVSVTTITATVTAVTGAAATLAHPPSESLYLRVRLPYVVRRLHVVSVSKCSHVRYWQGGRAMNSRSLPT